MTTRWRPTFRSRLQRVHATTLGCLLLGATAAGAQEVMLRATAGLAGQARPGRWTPVRVVARMPGEFAGTLAVEWGDARVERAVTLSPAAAKAFELYIRTDDPRDVVTVRLLSAGRSVAATDAPVTVVPFDPDGPAFIVCGSRGANPRGPGPCSVSLEPSAFPRSWRGLSAADDLSIADDDRAMLDADQRRAVGLASAQARLNLLGLGVPVLGPIPAARSFPSRPAAILAGYAAIAMLALALARWRRSAAAMLTLLFAGGCAAAAAVYASGRVGEAAMITLHHATSIDQYEDVDGAAATLRGVAEFPALDDYTVRADAADGTLVDSSADAATAIRYDESGLPLLTGRFTLGATVPVSFEGALTGSMLRVERDGATVHVTNIAAMPLSGCRLSGSLSSPRAGTLAPGATLTVTAGEPEDDPSITCAVDGNVLSFTDASRPVRMNGTTTLVLHLLPRFAHAEPGSDR